MTLFKGFIYMPAHHLGPLTAVFARMGFRFDGPYVKDSEFISFAWLIVPLIIVWFLPNTQQIMARTAPAFNFSGNPAIDTMPATSLSPYLTRRFTWDMRLAWAVVIGILCFGCLSSLNRVSEFLYFQF
jgi:hypothetical protein